MSRGELIQWNDDRGFGFIAGDDGQRYFVHISDIGRINTRPRQGDQVTFSAGTGRDGRPQAKSVAISGANPRGGREVFQRGAAPRTPGFDWRIPVALLLAVSFIGGLALARLPMELLVLYGVMGVVSLVNYRLDKHFAERGQWRTSEAMLLTIDLCFGIIGGLLGQALFRHKTRKQSYIAATLVIVAVHALWLFGLTLGVINVGQLLSLVSGML